MFASPRSSLLRLVAAPRRALGQATDRYAPFYELNDEEEETTRTEAENTKDSRNAEGMDVSQKPKARAKRNPRHKSEDFTPNLKRGLQRMERSLEMCATEIPDSVFDQIEADEKRAKADERYAKQVENRKKSQAIVEYGSRLRECKNLEECKGIHEEVKQNEMFSTFLGNLLIQTYNKFDAFDEARREFRAIKMKNVYSYNLMIKACMKSDRELLAKKLFVKMQKQGVEPDGFTVATVVGAYAKTGHLKPVRRVFDRLEYKDVPTWTGMIAAYTQNGKWKRALKLYRRMNLEGIHPNLLTLASLLYGCTSLKEGKALHERALTTGCYLDLITESSLVKMYVACGQLEEAKTIFDKMQRRNVVAWTAMISGYLQNGQPDEALNQYKRMQKGPIAPSMATYETAIRACSSLGNLAEGKAIHDWILGKSLRIDSAVERALFDMYTKAGTLSSLTLATEVFDSMQEKDLAIWNGLISAYATRGHLKEAAKLYQRMEAGKVKPDERTYETLLAACCDRRQLQEGKSLAASKATVEAELVNFLGKSGQLEEAKHLFDKIRKKHAVPWNALMSSYIQHGHGSEVLELYHSMVLEGVTPNDATFASVLLVCSQSGLEAQGRSCFWSIIDDYKLKPRREHFRSMVDLLGKTGKLSEAEELITSMPYPEDAAVWSSLLSACKLHKDVNRAGRAADKAFELGPKDSAPYVMLSSIYAAAGRDEDVKRVKEMMKEKGLLSIPEAEDQKQIVVNDKQNRKDELKSKTKAPTVQKKRSATAKKSNSSSTKEKGGTQGPKAEKKKQAGKQVSSKDVKLQET